MKKVVIVGPFNDEMKQALEKVFPEEFSLEYITSREEYGQLESADYIILRTLNFNAEDIARMAKTKLIQRWGVGFDTVDIQAAAANGIPVAVTYGMNSVPVAELALALTLAVYRNLVPLTEGIQAGRWEREKFASFLYHSRKDRRHNRNR
jgi:phosphoglycerate dehydrogenase-like enzyme